MHGFGDTVTAASLAIALVSLAMFVAIEARAGTRYRPEDARGLDSIAELPRVSRRLLVYSQSPRLTTASGIEVVGFDELVALLERGRL